MATTDYRTFCEDLARQAGAIMRTHFRNNPSTKYKADASPVTIADEAINRLVIASVKKTYPLHDVQGEEESHLANKGAHVWVCDPIDGTIPFVKGIPTNVFSLALVHDGVPIVAVVYDPYCDRLYYAEKGKGTTMNGERVRVSEHKTLTQSTIGVTTSTRAPYDLLKVNAELASMGTIQFNLGSVVYMGMLVASGQLDATFCALQTAHDAATTKLLIEEAGGRTTNIHGMEQRYDGPIDGFIGTNGLVHDALLSMIRDTESDVRRSGKHG